MNIAKSMNDLEIWWKYGIPVGGAPSWRYYITSCPIYHNLHKFYKFKIVVPIKHWYPKIKYRWNKLFYLSEKEFFELITTLKNRG